MAMDEDYARHFLDMRARGEAVAPGANPDQMSPRGFTPEVALLTVIADRQLLTRNAIIATAGEGGNEPPFEPLPRPETAVDRERERRVRDELLELDRLIRGV